MLIVKQAQFDALDAAMLERFKRRLALHVRELFPIATTWDDQRLRQVIDTAMAKAKGRGLLSERDVARFVDLIVQFGPDFEREPGLQWMAGALEDASVPVEYRMNQIFDQLGARAPAAVSLVEWWAQST